MRGSNNVRFILLALLYPYAMSEATIDIDGSDVSAETIIELADEILEDGVTNGTAYINGVHAADDGDNDSAVYLSGEGWQSDGYIYMQNLKERAEEAVQPTEFADFVEDEINNVEVVAEGDQTMFRDGGGVDVKGTQFRDVFGSNLLNTIQAHEDIKIGYIANTGETLNSYDEEFTVVNLIDQR